MNTADYNMRPSLFERFVLQPLGLQRDNSLVLWLLFLIGGTMLLGFWYFQGDIPVVLALLYLLGIVVISFLRADFSLYILLFSVLIFDQFPIPELNPFTYQIGYFTNLGDISYLSFPEFGVINPVELHILILIFSILFLLGFKKDFSWQPIPVFLPFLLFLFSVAVSVIYNMNNGFSLDVTGEIRGLGYFFVLYLLVPQIIREKSQLRAFFGVLIAGISLKACQVIGRFIELGFTTGGLQTLTHHEDTVLIVSLLMMLFGMAIFKVKDKQLVWLFLVSIPLLLAFYVGLGEIAYISLFASLVIFLMMLPSQTQWNFLKFGGPCILLLGIYGVLFWNSNSSWSRPVQVLKKEISVLPEYHLHLFGNTKKDLAKEMEYYTILGAGFGELNNKITQTPSRNAEPVHDQNQYAWLLVHTGFMGLLAYWYFFSTYVAKGVKVFLTVSDSYLKVVPIVIITAIINQMIASYFDLQLDYYRSMIFLGCLLGLLPAVEHYKPVKETSSDDQTLEETPRLSQIGSTKFLEKL